MKQIFDTIMEIVHFINDNSDEIEKALIKLVSMIGWAVITVTAIEELIEKLIN